MKTIFTSLDPVRLLCSTTFLVALGIGAVRAQAQAQTPQPAQAQTNPPAAPLHPVTSGDSTMVRNARVYSIQFPGGTAGEFFEFLKTNGFANDNVLFAGKAASIRIAPFTVGHVRLHDVARALELVSEDRLSVEVVEKGEQSDENIWRIKASPDTARVVTRTCAMPKFFRRSDGIGRFQPIVNAAERELENGLERAGGLKPGGRAHMMAPEKMVIVVGPPEYVDAVSSALEAAEKVAAADVEAVRNR